MWKPGPSDLLNSDVAKFVVGGGGGGGGGGGRGGGGGATTGGATGGAGVELIPPPPPPPQADKAKANTTELPIAMDRFFVAALIAVRTFPISVTILGTNRFRKN